jgi:hypothetical protein
MFIPPVLHSHALRNFLFTYPTLGSKSGDWFIVTGKFQTAVVQIGLNRWLRRSGILHLTCGLFWVVCYPDVELWGVENLGLSEEFRNIYRITGQSGSMK